MDSFSCILFLRNYIYAWKRVILSNSHSNNYIFSIKRCSIQCLSKTLTSKHLAENDVNMTSRWKNDVKIVILTSCMQVVLHPSCKTTFPSPGRVHGNSGRVCKKRQILFLSKFICLLMLRKHWFLKTEQLSLEEQPLFLSPDSCGFIDAFW